MEDDPLRQRIAFEAARLLHQRRVSTYHDARWQATRSITRRFVLSESLPTDLEIRVQLQQLMGTAAAFPNTLPGPQSADAELPADRFEHYLALLLPLDRVLQPRDTHPEGDVLYHSLQVFELTCDQNSWDEELLTAALLHDVGKGIDPRDAHSAGLMAVEGFITARTHWLIQCLPSAHQLREGTLGRRAWRRLASEPSWEELKCLAACDSEGRVPGRTVRTVHEALDYLQDLDSA